jgi:CheY-like chemotaxis protein
MPKTLLLADDSVTIQKVVGISFANEDVALLTVDNGDDAIARTREARPDIVLADVVMPGMNGYEVCEAIKLDPELRHTPVLLLTGTFEAFDEDRATRAGADGHITKPFEAQALVDQVNARLAQATATPVSASPTPAEQPTSMEDSLGLQSAPDMSSENGDSFDFFDEEITEPRTDLTPASSAETMLVSEELAVDGEADDAFAFEAGDELHGEFSSASSTSPGAEIDSLAKMIDPLSDSEMAPDSTVAILPDHDAFASAQTEPPTPPPTLGESDLAPPQQEVPSAMSEAAPPFEDLYSALPEEPASTRVIGEAATFDATPDDREDDADSGDLGETLILSDLDTDPLGDPIVSDGIDTAEASPAAGLGGDPLAELEPDDLAAEAVLDPAGGRDYDVSSSDLGDPLQEPVIAPQAAEEELSSPWPAEPAHVGEEDLSSPWSTEPPQVAEEDLSSPWPAEPPQVAEEDLSSSLPAEPPQVAEEDLSSPWPAEPPELAEAELLPEPAPDQAPEPAPDPLETSAGYEPEAATTSAPDLSPLAREQLHDALEKIAWEAFGDVTEQIVKQALERIEKVAWEVIPQMAETLIREEIRKLKGEDS